jgi:penicillin G amidase
MRLISIFLLMLVTSGCAAARLGSYAAMPDYPTFKDGQEIRFAALSGPVHVVQREDGIYRVEAENEHDLLFVQGYLQARDRMFQLDFIRRMAKGELASLLGNVAMGDRMMVDADAFQRFVGFGEEGKRMYATLDADERANMESFAAGVNAWMASGRVAIEHRLLGARPYAWAPEDSMAVFRFVMFGMTHNYTREIRRLLIACDAGVDALERIWPTRILFPDFFLPESAYPTGRYPVFEGVVPAMAEALPGMCPKPPLNVRRLNDTAPTEMAIYNPLNLLQGGIQASNNWVVHGSRTASGKPILANDPHLPHLNPPILWGVHQVLPGREVIGFSMIGTHRIFAGHNFHVAWGTTINNVDLQDLYVEKVVRLADGSEGYEYAGEQFPFEVRTATIEVKDGAPVTVSARFTRNGPVLNDLDPVIRDRIPVTTLRMVTVEGAGDSVALRDVVKATDAQGFVNALQSFDSACISWVFADIHGDIGYTSPCRVPKRNGFSGTFPAPGWLADYQWQGYYEKSELPNVMNPEEGWIATANNQALPPERFPSAYDNDSSPPNRYVRIADGLRNEQGMTVEQMTALQTDTGLSYWPQIRGDLDGVLCGLDPSALPSSPAYRTAAGMLCAWDGIMQSDSAAATIFVLWNNAVLDRALPDELTGGAAGEVWRYVQNIPHFETNVDRLWSEPVTAAVWNDVRTEPIETRDDIYRLALADAVTRGELRYGPKLELWTWGSVRPFVLKHFFGNRGGLLAKLFDAKSLPGVGGPETVFKNQFIRADRDAMHPLAGPAMRIVVDLAEPAQSRYSFAGGNSGWAGSPHYADLLPEWMRGDTRPLSPAEVVGKRILFRP